ncbi:hypothetical protein ABZ234_06775 [Nocardiopsis sp. NPDC006198]|uniref:Uncharacterized protein n=1 Tax=Streptomonospora nanhaiensis TaxID=1323731 RepID=A0ABY6YTS9_9ACTN|nr:hypothetical protein [Streptomonospora nanhaiensis]WAE75618.1 hypothetical protein OUQ99_11265 [Streptomonospora nanhaiensis]
MASNETSHLDRRGPGRAAVRPVSLLRPQVLAQVALGTPLLCDALRLARWSAPATPVSGPGVPSPESARAAIERFGLWPYGLVRDRGARVAWLRGLGSASDAAEFMAPWQAAVVLGMIEVDTARARPAPGLEDRVHDPEEVLDWWMRLFEDAVRYARADLLDPDPPRGHRPELLPAVLLRLYEGQDGARVPLASLATSAPPFPGAPPLPAGPEPDPDLVLHLLWQLSDTGAVILGTEQEAPPPADRAAGGDPGRGECADGPPASPSAQASGPPAHPDVELTDLGRYGVRRLLLRRGVRAPLAEDLAVTDAAEFLDSLARVRPADQGALVDPWLARRSPEEALEEIVRAVADPRLTLRRRTGASVLHMVSSRLAGRLRAMLRAPDRVAAGLAALVLLSSRMLPQEEIDAVLDRFGPWLVLDLASAAGTGADDLAAALDFAFPSGLDASLLESADRLWLCGHPDTVPALEAIGRLHRDPRVARAARGAAGRTRLRGL